jgi:hypothetical protein
MLVDAKQKSSKKQLMIVTECLDKEDCPILYTDIFGSILIECVDPKHNKVNNKKAGGYGKVTRPANPNPNQQIETSNLVLQQDSGALRD